MKSCSKHFLLLGILVSVSIICLPSPSHRARSHDASLSNALGGFVPSIDLKIIDLAMPEEVFEARRLKTTCTFVKYGEPVVHYTQPVAQVAHGPPDT